MVQPMSAVTQGDQASIVEALEGAALELETRAGNSLYRAAWKVAAKIVRARKRKYEQTANPNSGISP